MLSLESAWTQRSWRYLCSFGPPSTHSCLLVTTLWLSFREPPLLTQCNSVWADPALTLKNISSLYHSDWVRDGHVTWACPWGLILGLCLQELGKISLSNWAWNWQRPPYGEWSQYLGKTEPGDGECMGRSEEMHSVDLRTQPCLKETTLELLGYLPVNY